MKEFFKKHKIAIFASGGILLLLWLFYEYEQAQAANTATDATTTDPLQVGGTPLVYGTATDGSGGSSSPSTGGSTLGDFTGDGTTQQIPNTSGSGVPTSSPNNASTNAASPIVAPATPSTQTAAIASPYTTTAVTQDQANKITAVAAAAVAGAPCSYALNGINSTGVPTCGPNGYQFSGVNGLASIDPDVNGVLPGQSGYASAVQAQLATTEQMNPGDTQDIQNYEALLSAYGGITVSGETEGSSVPAGATQTAAPTSVPAYVANAGTGGQRGGLAATPAQIVQGGTGTSNVPVTRGNLPAAGTGGQPTTAPPAATANTPGRPVATRPTTVKTQANTAPTNTYYGSVY